MLGMTGNEVKDLKMIGRREMNMDPKMKDFFREIDQCASVPIALF